MTHQMLIGKIPPQMSAPYRLANDGVLVYRNKLQLSNQNCQTQLVILSPNSYQPHRTKLFNWDVNLISQPQLLSKQEFERILIANHYIFGDLYRANSKNFIETQYRQIDSYLSEEQNAIKRVNLLCDFEQYNELIIQFKQQNPETQPYSLNDRLYVNRRSPYITYIVYDQIKLSDPAILFYEKLVKNKAFKTIQEAQQYYSPLPQTVKELLFDTPTELGNVKAYRAAYSTNDEHVGFVAYARHIQQMHSQVTDLANNICAQCDSTQPCSLGDIGALMQPQLIPISFLKEYPIPLGYMDMIAQLYQSLLCQFKKWAYQDSTQLSLQMPISLEAITTSSSNNEQNYENLELLGDSILKYVVSCHLFLNYEDLDEGQMTYLRSSIVKNTFLKSLMLQSNIINMDLHFTQVRNPLQKNIAYSENDPPLQDSQMADIYEAIGGDVFNRTKSFYEFISYLRNTNFPISQLKHKILDFEEIDDKQQDYQDYQYEFINQGLRDIAYNDYERFEFLGDAALEVMVVNLLNRKQNKTPGILTDLKSKYLSNAFMGEQAIKMGFVQGNLDNLSKYHGDIFESMAAAILLDGGWKALNKVYGSLYIREIII